MRYPPLLAILNIVALTLSMRLVFSNAAITTIKPAIMMTFLSTKPAKASDMVAQPVSTRRTQAISGGAPKANLSDMIMTIMPITIANVMII